MDSWMDGCIYKTYFICFALWTFMSQAVFMEVHVLCGDPVIKLMIMQLFVPLSLKQFITVY